jgi:hypothetical protein
VFRFEETFFLYTLWEILDLKLMTNLTSTKRTLQLSYLIERKKNLGKKVGVVDDFFHVDIIVFTHLI